MSARDHTAIEELLALRALGGLDTDEDVLEAEMASHGDCPVCRELEAGFVDAAALLAASLDPVPIDHAVTERLLAAARGDAPVGATPSDELARRRSRRVWIAAVAASFVLIITGAMIRTSGPTGVSIRWGARVVRFEGGEGELAMAYVPGEPGVAFWGRDLPDPGPDRTYEIWMIDGETAIPGGCVTPVDGRLAAFVDADVGTTDTMAVTVEPASCPAEPSGEPVLLAPLS